MQKWDVHTFVLSSGVPSASGCSYSLCGFSLLSKYLFMLVRDSHRLVRIAIGAGRQIFDNCSRFASWKRQRTKGANSLSRAGSKTKTKKYPKEVERERSGRAKAAAAEPDKPGGLYLLLKFCSVRKCIVTSLKSTAIYKLTLLHKPVLWQPNRHHCQGNYLVE